MESADLARWQRFAAKGGIGKATAIVDRVAEEDGDLMFLKDDEVTVLMQLPQAGFYLGFCEGVVGRFKMADVQIHGKLKRAVMARRPASGNPASPSASLVSLPTTPNPVVPHTTYSPARSHPVDIIHAHTPSNSLTGVSAWLAAQPPAHDTPSQEAAATESISSHPSSPIRDASPTDRALSTPSPNSKARSPLHVHTSPPAQRESQSLDSLASTEASPLSDTSHYSFRRPGTGTEIVRSEQGDTQAPQLPSESSHPDPDSSQSRASTPSVGDPFQHDDRLSLPAPARSGSALQPDTTSSSLTSAEMVKTPLANGDLSLDVQVHEQEERLYPADRESKYSVDHSVASDDHGDRTLSRGDNRVVSTLSDGEVGIGLSLIGGLLGAGAGKGDDGSDSESDYGQPSENGSQRAAGVAQVTTHESESDEASLYRDDSLDDHPTKPDGNATLGGNMAPHTDGTVTPTPETNGAPRASQSPGSVRSRSSTPPFGFELEPTTAPPAGGLSALSNSEGAGASPVQGTTASSPTARDESDDESDYGEEVPPTQPSDDRPSLDTLQYPPEDDFDLPPVRPPYHRASTSVRSITSSDAGGYYDDAIYDHYRSSYVSMAARSIRMSLIGSGEEVPPLPDAEHRFAPLNISPRSGGSGGEPSPGWQAQFSPGLTGPKSPRSPLAQTEMAPQQSSSPAKSEVREKEEEVTSRGPPLSVVTTGLASETTGLTPIAVTAAGASPVGLAPPLSPIPSSPPSPALSSNLASTLRQAIEQQRGPEPTPEPMPESDTQSIDEDKPILASPAIINSPQTHSGYEPSPIASLQRRPSQFAPHPNAPKPAHMFNSNYPSPSPAMPAQPTGPQHMHLQDALQLVIQRVRGGIAGGPPTIHGRTHSELALSSGPVPISFVFDPDGRTVMSFNHRPAGVPTRMIGTAQRSASMNAPAGGQGGEYVGSRLRPRSRSFSSVPQEQLVEIRSAGEPSTPHTHSAPMSPMPVAPSPLAQPPTPGPAQTQPPDSAPAHPASPAGSAPSSPVKQISTPPNPPTPSTTKGPFRGLRQVASNTMMRVGLQNGAPGVPRQSSDGFRPSPLDSPVLASQPKQSVDIPRSVAAGLNVHTPSPTSASPMASSNVSLHSKVSSTGLRLARVNGPMADTPTTPLSPVGSTRLEEETVHFNDMDFDMIKPMRSRVSIVRTSEDGRPSISRSSHHSEFPHGQQDDDLETSPVSPTAASARTPSASTFPLAARSHSSLTTSDSIAAHISREQRWISTMQTIPSASVRRNKKIKKLLLEGVPASVRGVVWLYLTDSKARRMMGLYSQLTKRGKVPATPEIIKDIDFCFTAQPHLQAPDGPVTSILQAYLTMVPDVTYSQGLCRSAGHLLMHSPEEDAFWTFVALMDKHLRGYCAVNSLQLEADSVFFAKSLESNEPQLAAKLFRELGLHAGDFCKPWILSGFFGVVPLEYSCRIWDIFLFEGAPFLFRVALVLLGYVKKQIMALGPKSSPGALDCLLSISPQLLPADPDQLINAAYAVKFKEDDMRKTRPKTEAQLRKEPGFNRPVLNRDTIKK